MDEQRPPEIDERWLVEWIEFGWRELDRYLDRQARFTDWLETRDER